MRRFIKEFNLCNVQFPNCRQATGRYAQWYKNKMNILKSIVLLLLITSCNFSKEEKKSGVQKNKSIAIATDSVLVPKFEIELKLSEKAEEKLLADKETVIVQALFFGIPKDTTLQSEEYQELGRLTIGSKTIELKKERIARFYNCKISKKTLKSLSDKNFEVNINVFTGRKSSSYNLIDCEFLQEGIDSVKNKRLVLKGKLLFGE